MVEELEKIAVVNLLQRRSIISLIGNVQRSSLILEKVSDQSFLFIIFFFLNLNFLYWKMTLQAFHVLHKNGVNVQMISQGASKVMHELSVSFIHL